MSHATESSQRAPGVRPTLLLAATILVTLVFSAVALRAAPPSLSAAEAHRLVAAGELILIDVRTTREWAATGQPAGAVGATWRGPEGTARFVRRIAEITAGRGDTPIALICASGVRSGAAARVLRENGYGDILDISEGMSGSASGVGWLRRQLPLQPCQSC